MTIEEVREFASAVGILMPNRYSRKDNLIRMIQLSMGKDDCFGFGVICRQNKCEWRDDCMEKKLAEGETSVSQ